MARVGLGEVVFGWELGWVGLVWFGLGWVGLGWLGWAGLGLGWVGLGWVELGCIGLWLWGFGLDWIWKWIEWDLHWTGFGLDNIKMDWFR